MIVWDSREAEERNARGKLMDAERALARTRRRVRIMTCAAALIGVVLLFDCVTLAFHPSVTLPLLMIPAASAGVYLLVQRRRFIAEFLPRDIERWHQAQELCDRVFGGER